MTQRDAIKFWLQSSADDIDTAKTMLTAGRYNYAMFMCQQSLEELLKAIIIIQTNEQPPFIHDLINLSKKINLEIPGPIREGLRSINPHYIVARYKPQRFDPTVYNKVSAKKTIKTAQEIIKWFTKEMGLKTYLPSL